MHRTSEVLLPFCITNLCSFQYVPVVCACLLVKYVDFFHNLMQFHQFIWGWCLGLSLRTGGGDLITGGDSAGEVFSEYTPLGAFNLVNSLIFPSAREVHTLLHLLRCW